MFVVLTLLGAAASLTVGLMSSHLGWTYGAAAAGVLALAALGYDWWRESRGASAAAEDAENPDDADSEPDVQQDLRESTLDDEADARQANERSDDAVDITAGDRPDVSVS